MKRTSGIGEWVTAGKQSLGLREWESGEKGGSGRLMIPGLRPQVSRSSSTVPSDLTYTNLKTKLLRISRWQLKNVKPQAQDS